MNKKIKRTAFIQNINCVTIYTTGQFFIIFVKVINTFIQHARVKWIKSANIYILNKSCTFYSSKNPEIISQYLSCIFNQINTVLMSRRASIKNTYYIFIPKNINLLQTVQHLMPQLYEYKNFCSDLRH